MPSIDAVCFDLDSTLCLSEQSDREIHDAVFEQAGIDPLFTVEEVRAVDPETVETATTRAGFYTNLYREVLRRQGTLTEVDASLLAELGEITTDVVDEAAVSFRPDAQAAFEYARERYAVGLITNGGADTQTAKLERLGIADAFDVTVFCDPDDGIEPKPATAPFETALAALGTPPEATVHVGNSHSQDVVGAHRAGLQSVWVPAPHEDVDPAGTPTPAPTHRLDAMDDLPDVL